jgi:hypothetical protein
MNRHRLGTGNPWDKQSHDSSTVHDANRSLPYPILYREGSLVLAIVHDVYFRFFENG